MRTQNRYDRVAEKKGAKRMRRFVMTCPKCKTTDYTIERDNRGYSDARFGLIFSCRCGKQLFGEQVLSEHDRQLREHESGQGAKPAKPAKPAEDDALRVAYAPRAATKQQEARAKKWEPTWNAQDAEVCEWNPCTNPRRPNSKYCSRACSNKNARWRYKHRQRSGKEAA